MKQFCSHFTLTFLTLVCGLTVFGQKNILQKSIYFETSKFELSTDSKIILDNLVDSTKTFQSFSFFIKGNTDNIGDSTFNKKLSEQRVLAAQQYFISKGINPTVFSTSAFGEDKPIGDNLTEKGKQKNRRVDISISFTRPVPIDSSQFLPSIFELYKQTERKPQEFCIEPSRDTVLRCEKGTLVYVKANSFKISNSCKSNCVTIKIKEDFLKSDMILDNLSTTSNGKIIETQGMVYTEANDCKGNKINLVKGKDLIIFLPTDTVRQDAQIFQGNRTPHDNIMNWTVNNNSVLSNFKIEEINECARWLCGGVRFGCDRCKFFFCRIKRIDDGFKGLINKSQHRYNVEFRHCQRQLRRERRYLRKNGSSKPLPSSTVVNSRPEISDDLLPKCKRLEDLYKQYGVTNIVALTEAINKPLLDTFNVKTIQELQDTMRKANLNKVELSYLNKSLSYDDFKYYVYNTSKLGWSNVDCFADIKPDQMVTMKIDLKVAKNIDCKIVFKNRRFVIPATKEENKYEFEKIPKGETVWIIAMKYDEGKPYLFMQETTVENKTIEVEFKSLTLDELKEKLKVLDE
ncbi:MAG: OmpA family protein [Bacteroidota bacterium]